MADALTTYIRRTLPSELADALTEKLDDLESGKFARLFSLPLAKTLFGHEDASDSNGASAKQDRNWRDSMSEKLELLMTGAKIVDSQQYTLVIIALAALQAFLQANVTGPPLSFDAASLVFPAGARGDELSLDHLRTELRTSLGRDGEAVYVQTPNIELLYVACSILSHPRIQEARGADWALLRARFVQQRTLSDIASSLQDEIYGQMKNIDALLGVEQSSAILEDIYPPWLLEKAAIDTHHGLDKEARHLLDEAASSRDFTFTLTGVLGKRTKYQENETSQLVVLARSKEETPNGTANGVSSDRVEQIASSAEQHPSALDLNDDTLLERISFTSPASSRSSASRSSASISMSILDSASLPPTLSALDPSAQPLLTPLDSITLLLLASSITNTRPSDGLTREETLPYASRVLEGGSSNWQVYTQALLLRSRIEGYRSRTTERGLLQLQALVDQIIVETTAPATTSAATSDSNGTSAPSITLNAPDPKPTSTTFLPPTKPTDTAPASARLQYIHLLCTPFRWTLESELAARWTSLGGLRTALEIYERLEMWAETALCWAAVERDDKARRTIRRLLFHPSGQENDGEAEDFNGPPIDSPPNDAPRLYCILGDLSLTAVPSDPTLALQHFNTGWSLSRNRYARAQRSIARLHYSARDFSAAAIAYAKALEANATNGSSWFAMGCCLLELGRWESAAEAFRRTVGLDESDAEGWSNLAAALVRMYDEPETSKMEASVSVAGNAEGSDEDESLHKMDTTKHLRAALSALRRASTLSHDSVRIAENLLAVSLRLSPPSWPDVLGAQRRIIELAGPSRGEACLDISAIEGLAHEVVTGTDFCVRDEKDGVMIQNPAVSRGLPRMFLGTLDAEVIPLITTSARLWRVVSTVRLWQARPGESLGAMESAWRCVTGVGGGLSAGGGGGRAGEGLSWIEGDRKAWGEVVRGTEELVDGYESLGLQVKERIDKGDVTRGEGVVDTRDGDGEELVAPDWRFKARSAIRSVLGKAKGMWEDDEGYSNLKKRLDDLKG